MQERIKQLAVESGLVAFVDFDGALVTERDDQTDPVIRFAQAVARECAEVADSINTDHNHAWGSANAQNAAHAIRARFNITE